MSRERSLSIEATISYAPPVPDDEWPEDAVWGYWECTCRNPQCGVCAEHQQIAFTPEGEILKPRSHYYGHPAGPTCWRSPIFALLPETDAAMAAAAIRRAGGRLPLDQLDAAVRQEKELQEKGLQDWILE